MPPQQYTSPSPIYHFQVTTPTTYLSKCISNTYKWRSNIESHGITASVTDFKKRGDKKTVSTILILLSSELKEKKKKKPYLYHVLTPIIGTKLCQFTQAKHRVSNSFASFLCFFFGGWGGGAALFDKTIIIQKDGCYCQTWTPWDWCTHSQPPR